MSRLNHACLTTILVAMSGCHEEASCILPPCALPLAIEVTVTDERTGASVPAATFTATGPVTGGGPCPDGMCVVPGPAGTYTLDITAPGYRPAQRTIEVTGSNPHCGCPTADTKRVTVALVSA